MRSGGSSGGKQTPCGGASISEPQSAASYSTSRSTALSAHTLPCIILTALLRVHEQTNTCRHQTAKAAKGRCSAAMPM